MLQSRLKDKEMELAKIQEECDRLEGVDGQVYRIMEELKAKKVQYNRSSEKIFSACILCKSICYGIISWSSGSSKNSTHLRFKICMRRYRERRDRIERSQRPICAGCVRNCLSKKTNFINFATTRN